MFGLAAAAWQFLPEAVPIQWSGGAPTSYVGREAALLVALLTIPLLALGLHLAIWLASRRHSAPAGESDSLGEVQTGVAVALLAVHVERIVAYMGYGPHPTVVLGLVLALCGYRMRMAPQNGLVGVKTPWALRSRRSWQRSNRLGGRVLLALGAAGVVMDIFTVPGALWIVLAALVVSGIVLTLYSYSEWRRDPDAEQLAPSTLFH